MKRNFALLFALVMIFTLAGCGAEKQADSTAYVDKTVKADTFTAENYNNISNVVEVIDFSEIYNTKEELYANAVNVVYGTVKEKSYFDESGSAHTIYTFAVEKVYKGSLSENDLISVMTIGGCVRLSKRIELYGNSGFEDYTDEQINNTLLKESFGVPEPEIGDKYLLFLDEPINNEPPFPDGVYSELGSFMGRYVQEGKNFVRLTPENEPNFYTDGEDKMSMSATTKYLRQAKEELAVK